MRSSRTVLKGNLEKTAFINKNPHSYYPFNTRGEYVWSDAFIT